MIGNQPTFDSNEFERYFYPTLTTCRYVKRWPTKTLAKTGKGEILIWGEKKSLKIWKCACNAYRHIKKVVEFCRKGKLVICEYGRSKEWKMRVRSNHKWQGGEATRGQSFFAEHAQKRVTQPWRTWWDERLVRSHVSSASYSVSHSRRAHSGCLSRSTGWPLLVFSLSFSIGKLYARARFKSVVHSASVVVFGMGALLRSNSSCNSKIIIIMVMITILSLFLSLSIFHIYPQSAVLQHREILVLVYHVVLHPTCRILEVFDSWATVALTWQAFKSTVLP